MSKVPAFLPSVLANKCPVCRQGNLYVDGFLYNPQVLTKMHANCPTCKTKLQPEPGFYFGAAYVSYGLTVALWVAVFVALETFGAIGLIEFSFFDDIATFLITGIIVLLLLTPPIYRLSRSIWGVMFLKFDQDLAEKIAAKTEKKTK